MIGVLLSLVLLLGAADPVDQAVSALREDPLYVSSASTITPDRAAVRAALADTPVPTYVAVVPEVDVAATDLGIDGLMLRLVEGLADPRAVVVVVSDAGELQAGEGGASGVDAAAVLDRVLAARLDEPFDDATLTAALVEVARLVGEQAGPPVALQEPGATRRTVGLAGLLATVVVGGGGALYLRSQRRLRAAAPLTEDDAPAPGWH